MNRELETALTNKGLAELPSVLIAAAECAPLAKTGGLADVVGTLPKALKKLGMDVRIIIPYHRIIKDKYASEAEHLFHFYVNLGWRHEYAGIEKLVLDGTVIYLVDSERYFGDKIYRGGDAEGEQYAFFSLAVLDAIPELDFTPSVVHCNDWHTAMLPMLAKTRYPGSMQEKLRFLLTIHNIAFQGRYSFDFVGDYLSVDSRYLTPDYIELYGCANYMKAGCVFSDWINTVSPTYADEIRTPYYGEGLDGVLDYRKERLSGIINGIDTDMFNPSNEKTLAANYTPDDLSGKAVCKKHIQEELGLDINPHVPLVAMVTRMTEQKGFDMVAAVLDRLLWRNDMQFVLLGTGDERFEKFMTDAVSRHPGRLAVYIGYNEELAHSIYAASDFYLMPSRFEPCGLSQMIAMRYGSLPIVRETGGLKDTVQPYNRYTDEGTGFSFANYNPGEMMDIVEYALSFYHNQKVMSGLRRRAMSADYSFDLSALEYAKLYIKIL